MSAPKFSIWEKMENVSLVMSFITQVASLVSKTPATLKLKSMTAKANAKLVPSTNTLVQTKSSASPTLATAPQRFLKNLENVQNVPIIFILIPQERHAFRIPVEAIKFWVRMENALIVQNSSIPMQRGRVAFKTPVPQKHSILERTESV